MLRSIFIFTIALLLSFHSFSQGSPDYNGGFKIKFDENGQKYLRLISWAQMQANYNIDAETTAFQLRRARLLLFGQVTKDFMIVTHFGANSMNANTLSPTGKGDGVQLFFHDVWAQYNIGDHLSVGGGLHYFNGVSRLNSQSTLNIMTLDNNRSSWATLGLTDQFGRHLGFFAKGDVGRFQFQVAVNDALTNGLDDRDPSSEFAVYGGKHFLDGQGSKNYAGYFTYHFFDKESNFLPFKVGSYLGGKKVLTMGAGFFMHPNGSVILQDEHLVGENVNLLAADIFYDAPVGQGAITAYAVLQNNDYGTNYYYSAYGTGTMFYTHAGYVIPGEKEKTRFQPYLSFLNHSYDATDDVKSRFGIGLNTYFSGHNSKLTLEYAHQKMGEVKDNILSIQAMIYL